MNERKTVIIIGAGVSGLSAAINAEQNGMHAILIESQPYVGGFCTGWYRKGRYLDGCLHWLTGTNPNTDLYKMWKNVHAIEKDEDIVYLDSFGAFEYEGTVVTFWKDIKRAEKEWTLISREDKKEIHHFFNMVKDFVSVDTPTSAPMMDLPFKRFLKAGFDVLRVWPSYLLTMKISTDDYAKRFKHPALQNAIRNVQPGKGNLFSMLFSYSTIVANNGGIPLGGSKAMAERMKDYFLELGGTLLLKSQVEKIIVNKQSKRASGVKLSNQEIINGDYIITTVAPNVVTNKLLSGSYQKPRFMKRMREIDKNPCPSCMLLQFEIEDIPNINIPFTFQIEDLKVGTRVLDNITLRSYGYDKETYVKGNKTIASCLIDQYDEDYFYWEKLYKNDYEAYKNKKNEIALEVKNRIIKRFPELENKITIMDVATPMTMKRYTNSPRGAYMSFLFTKKNTMYNSSGLVKGINNLFLAGQWVLTPGGLPFALMSGHFAIQRVCKQANRDYLLSPLLNFKTNKN